MVPIFPELRSFLEAVWEEATPGTEYVITRYRDDNANLQSTRPTELEETFPSHVVCAWLGNSPRVAAKHYLQVTDDHFAKATECAAQQSMLSEGIARGALETNCEISGDVARTRRPILSGVGDAGLDHAQESPRESPIPFVGAAESAAVDSDLAIIANAWMFFTPRFRNAMLAAARKAILRTPSD